MRQRTGRCEGGRRRIAAAVVVLDRRLVDGHRARSRLTADGVEEVGDHISIAAERVGDDANRGELRASCPPAPRRGCSAPYSMWVWTQCAHSAFTEQARARARRCAFARGASRFTRRDADRLLRLLVLPNQARTTAASRPPPRRTAGRLVASCVGVEERVNNDVLFSPMHRHLCAGAPRQRAASAAAPSCVCSRRALCSERRGHGDADAADEATYAVGVGARAVDALPKRCSLQSEGGAERAMRMQHDCTDPPKHTTRSLSLSLSLSLSQVQAMSFTRFTTPATRRRFAPGAWVQRQNARSRASA